MPESVGVYRSIEAGPKSPVRTVQVNSAVESSVRSIVPEGQDADAYLARRVGMSLGEATGERNNLRVMSPTGKRALTIRFFRPHRVNSQSFTSLTAKGVGIGDETLATDGEEPFGLFGQKDAEKELRESESLHKKGVRVSRVAAIVSLNRQRLQEWIREQPKGRYNLESMLRRLKEGEDPAILIRFDNPRWSDLFSAKSRGPYSASAIARLGAHSLFSEMDMNGGGDILGAVYNYQRSQKARAALHEITTSRHPSPESLLEYLRLEAFFSGYNHARLLKAGAKLNTARLPQDTLVGGALFTDFENMNMGGPATPEQLEAVRGEFAESIAKRMVKQGFAALHILEQGDSLSDMQDIFSQGFQAA